MLVVCTQHCQDCDIERQVAHQMDDWWHLDIRTSPVRSPGFDGEHTLSTQALGWSLDIPVAPSNCWHGSWYQLQRPCILKVRCHRPLLLLPQSYSPQDTSAFRGLWPRGGPPTCRDLHIELASVVSHLFNFRQLSMLYSVVTLFLVMWCSVNWPVLEPLLNLLLSLLLSVSIPLCCNEARSSFLSISLKNPYTIVLLYSIVSW